MCKCFANGRVLDKVGCFNLSRQQVSIVDSEISSFRAKWVTGHQERLEMIDVFSPADSLKLVSGGTIHKILRIPGAGDKFWYP